MTDTPKPHNPAIEAITDVIKRDIGENIERPLTYAERIILNRALQDLDKEEKGVGKP